MNKVIIVDDEPDILDVLTEILVSAGFEVSAFNDPKKALEAIKEQDFQLVITDLKMPVVSGIEIADAAKEAKPESEVIVITGYASLDTAIKSVQSNVYDYILKPFNVSKIVMTVQKAVETINLKALNKVLNKKVEKALSDITILHEVTKIINSSTETKDVINFAVGTIEASVEIGTFSIMLYDESSSSLRVTKSVGFSEQFNEYFLIKLNEGIIGQAIKAEETVDIAGFENDEIFQSAATPEDKEKVKSFLSIPLSSQGHLIGIITIHTLDSSNIDDYEKIKLLEVLSINIAPNLQAGLFKTEREMLLADPFSGARTELRRYIQKAKDYKGTLSILIVKLYLKKRENADTKVLEASDQVLEHVTSAIAPVDAAMRIGIDTIVVILQGKTKMLTEEVAAKIKSVSEKNKILSENGFLIDYGYADFPMDGKSFEELISKAQSNLWKFVKQ